MKNKIVFIGNSIVNGFPLSRGRSFPGLARAALKEGVLPEAGSGNGKKPVPVHADVINKGANGETTADILRRFEHDVLDHAPLAVFILTGTNDFIYREADPAACMDNLQQMIRMAEEAGIVPVIMTPLAVDAEKAEHMWMSGMGVDYEKVNGEIETFSEMVRESGQLYADTEAEWKGFVEGTAQLSDLPLQKNGELTFQEDNTLPEHSGDAYLDGVHPTPEGYRFLAGVALAWIMEHTDALGLK